MGRPAKTANRPTPTLELPLGQRLAIAPAPGDQQPASIAIPVGMSNRCARSFRQAKVSEGQLVALAVRQSDHTNRIVVGKLYWLVCH
jgi:hypothetical protein